MKISELFVSLGFKVDGGTELEKVDRNIGKAEVSALGLLAAVGALNAAFYAMMNRAVEAAVGLDRWRRATGENTDELQRMQYGAERLNVASKTVNEAIQTILKTRSEIALGNVDASSPWFLLGIDPRQDPIKVLNQLRQALASIDPALGRTLVQRMGFGDDLLYFLQQKEQKGGLFVTREEYERLTLLGGAWRGFLFNLSTVATKFAAAFADNLAKVVGWLDKGVLLMNRFVTWLNSGTTAATAFRGVLFGIVLALGAAFIALAGVVGLLGILKGLLIAIQLIPIVTALSGVAAVIAVMAAALVGLILLIEDFWTQIDGGKSLFDWNQNLILTVKNVEALAGWMGKVADFWREITSGKANPELVGKLFKDITGITAATDWYKDMARVRVVERLRAENSAKVDIYVDGARDPLVVGREVGRTVNDEISNAYGTAPIPTN